MRRFESDLHYLKLKQSPENIAMVHRTPCSNDGTCAHSLCAIARTIDSALRDWGYTAVRQPTIRYSFPPLKKSSALQLRIGGMKIGTFHVENDRVPEEFVRGFDVDYNLCTSWHMVEAFERSGIAPERLIFCPLNAVDAEVFNPIIPYPVEKNDKPFTFLWVGATQPRKGTDVLIEAFDKAFTPKDNVQLVIKDGGYGQQRWTESLIAASPMRSHIKYIFEEIGVQELADLYRSVSFDKGAFVHPHRAEGFGRPILEAMMCGCRVGMTGWGGPLDFEGGNHLFEFDLVESKFHNHPGEPYFSCDEEQPLWAEPIIDSVVDWMRKIRETPCEKDALLIRSSALGVAYGEENVRYNIVERLNAVLPDAPPSYYGSTYWEGGGESNYDGYCENECHVNQARMLVDLFDLKGKKVLDLGAGYGYLVKNLRELGVDAYGLDISQYAVQKSPVREYMALGDVSRLNEAKIPSGFPTGDYDFVFSLDMLEHVPPKDIRWVFRSIKQLVAADGGVCLIPGTMENHTLCIDKTHRIFRGAPWWTREFTQVFGANQSEQWKTRIYDALTFAKVWWWHPLVSTKEDR